MPAKMRESHLIVREIANDIPRQSAPRYLPVSGLLVDLNRECWIDPLAEVYQGDPAARILESGPLIRVIRGETGFVVSLSRSEGHKWKPCDLAMRPPCQLPLIPAESVTESFN